MCRYLVSWQKSFKWEMSVNIARFFRGDAAFTLKKGIGYGKEDVFVDGTVCFHCRRV